MATLPFNDAVVTVNSKVLSPDGVKVDLDYSSDELFDTAFGDTTKSRIGGLKDWGGTLEFNQDFAATPAPDVDLFAIVGTVVPIAIAAVSGTTTATNPEYQGNALITSYKIFGQGVGELAKAVCTFVAAGNLTRAVT
ncbi:hypothetical protein LCGC14_3169230 [marine sediment metagenome]|uniref:Uncharacterized protein n=1 Tax=marine sediment metagenome TaxID=412755 RepID=A0A0F8Y3W6_9ZZZZ